MFRSQRYAKQNSEDAQVDLAPLIDVVFILLIFFLVSATLDPDAGIEIERPQAASGHATDSQALRVLIAASGNLYMDGRVVDLRQVRERIAAQASARGLAVVLVPDRVVPSGRLIEVMDAMRLAGAQAVTVATTREGAVSGAAGR